MNVATTPPVQGPHRPVLQKLFLHPTESICRIFVLFHHMMRLYQGTIHKYLNLELILASLPKTSGRGLGTY